MLIPVCFSSSKRKTCGILFMWSLKNQSEFVPRSFIKIMLIIIIDNYYRRFWNFLILIIFLIESTFFRTFLKVCFSRYLPVTVTNVQKVSIILTFSFLALWVSLRKSKLHILSLSCFVWVNGSKRVNSPSSRVMLHAMSWYVNNLFIILLKSKKFKEIYYNITILLSLSEKNSQTWGFSRSW